MIKRYPLIRQDELKDCGPACIATLIKYYNGYIPLGKIRDMCKTTKMGTTAYDIIATLKKNGFQANGFKTNMLEISKKTTNYPLIAHVTVNKFYQHYIIIYEINPQKKSVIIGDPQDKVKKISFEEFEKMWNKIIITAYPIKKIACCQENTPSLFKYIMKLLKNYKGSLCLIFILSIFLTFLAIISSFYLQYMIDGINAYKTIDYFLIGFIMFSIFNIIKNFSVFFRNKILMFINNKIDEIITNDTFNSIISLPYRYYKNHTIGEIITRIKELSCVKEVISKVALSLFLDLPLTIIALIVLYNINQTLFLIAIIILLLYNFSIILFKNKYEKHLNLQQVKNAFVTSYLVESITAFETIKGLNLEKNIIKSFSLKYHSLIKNNLKLAKIINLQYLLKETINTLGPLIIVTLGSILVLNKEITLGELMTFNVLLAYFLAPIRNIIDLDNNIKEAKIVLRRITDLAYKNDDQEREVKTIKGTICFKNLTFSFNDRDIVLDNINLIINRKDKVMLVGSSGSGKSTIGKLLMKYYLVNCKQIFIDNVDINKYSSLSIKQNMAYIAQNETLFTDTIYNNIIVDREIDHGDFLKIVKICEVDKIVTTNLGYNTMLEENGFNISGGEKQRIVLARTLLKNFNVLIIDEGLNEMDVNLERRILKKIFHLFKDKTIIIISHRFNNQDLFNKVIELKNGKVVEISKNSKK
ncbi:MAG: peptidase domain-containing ABC transporter [Bacilli bacterium]